MNNLKDYLYLCNQRT